MSDSNMIKLTVRQGAQRRQITVDTNEVKTVGDLRNKYGEKLNITNQHSAYVSTDGANSTAASDDTALSDGMSMQFSQNSGQKG